IRVLRQCRYGSPSRPRTLEEGSMKLLRGIPVGLLALMAAACASTPPPAEPTVNVTGTWVGEFVCTDPSKGSGSVVMKLNQTGSRVSGDVQVSASARLTNA